MHFDSVARVDSVGDHNLHLLQAGRYGGIYRARNMYSRHIVRDIFRYQKDKGIIRISSKISQKFYLKSFTNLFLCATICIHHIRGDNFIRRRRVMPRVISDECITCGTCEAQCPVSAISMGSAHFEVNVNECIDCGACEAACPVSAIKEK